MKKLLGLSLAFPLSAMSFGQAISVNGGSIQGTITDSTGAAVPNAPITITGIDTGSVKTLTADGSGFYSIGPLNPGGYRVTVAAPGFQTLQVTTVVRTGTATSGNFKLTVGQSSETIEVTTGALQVNTEQVGVSAVITQKQLDSLPVNGRNFLAFAQLQPGVQLQNADSGAVGGFDPTKAGYSALSFSGISGRTTRILLDGQDITDETVGSTIFNVTSGSVGEFQVNRATQDPSVDITSTGSVIASTRSGTNGYHGQIFYNFQDHRVGFAEILGADVPFQRNQFGGEIGGPIIKDKLFFFANSERIKQDQSSPSPILTGSSAVFQTIRGNFSTVAAPARDTYSTGRLDYNGPKGIHFFARVNYESNAFDTGNYQLYANRDNTPGIAGGADFVTGKFTHSFRGSYEKFHNLIADATTGNSSIYNPIPGFAVNYTAQNLHTGPNDDAPQGTFQSDKQLRYDGSTTIGKHDVRFGASVNRILGGGFASFFGAGPYASIRKSTLIPGADPGDPINSYTPYYVYVGNGQGNFTEIPQFGFPGGGQGDWRLGFYINDSIKLTPTFTLSLGARYDRDTGRSDSDLATIPCSQINASAFTSVPCTGNSPLLDQFGAGLGGRIAQPNRNVGPQIGFTYSPAALKNKTVFRGGLGLYYETSVFNNVLFDRPGKLASGHFNSYTQLCVGGLYKLNVPGKGQITQNSAGQSIQSLCNESLSQAAPGFLTLENDFKTASATTATPNANYVGNVLAVNDGNQFLAPNYRSPYAININFGVQHELFRGAILSADYVHVATLHIAQTIDANRVGDSRYFNLAAAQAAVAATTAAAGCTGGSSQAAITCAIASGDTIADFAGNGLDSGVNFYGGTPASFNNATPDTGAAFAGVNPAVGQGLFQFPTGKSAYDGLQLNFREQRAHPVRGLSDSNIEVSYAYSRVISTTGGANSSDTFFSATAQDYRNATQYIGYGSLDRTHQLSLGGSVTVARGPQLAFLAHFNSSLPTSLTLDNTELGGAAEIFRTDVTGDGTTGDLLPGTNQGAYQRKIKPNQLNGAISNYNATQAGTLTPAGQTLVASGLFSAAQLTAAKGVVPSLAPVPTAGAFGNSPYRQLDLIVSYPVHIPRLPESIRLEPAVAMYNALNLANFDGPSGQLLTPADETTGSVNSPYNGFDTKNSYRQTRGIGTFSQGSPRSTEFQLKLNF